jgi:tRNA U34 5-carboxymethylaminomethyl modifying GTPase MnmE/TrmE
LYDLPGFRESDDSIEQEAIALAKTIANEAVLTILISDSENNWLETTRDSLQIATKSDVHKRDDADLNVSAQTGENMQELSLAIRNAIIPPDLIKDDRPWFFAGYRPTELKPQST